MTSLENDRYLGYCFNPVSFYYIFDRPGAAARVVAVVAEVAMEWSVRLFYRGMEWERNGMQWNGMEWDEMELNGMGWNGMPWNVNGTCMEWVGTQRNAMECYSMECSAVQCNAMQCNRKRCVM